MEKITFLDFETTGFKDNCAVSLALISFKDQELVAKKYFLINPMVEIESGAYRIHNIGYVDIKDKPTFKELWESEIRPYVDDSIIIAHNSKYDTKVLKKEIKRYGLSCNGFKSICTCDNAKKFISKQEISNYKLNTLCEYFDIKLTNHHNAKDDTLACKNLYFKLLELGEMQVKEEPLD